MPATETLTLTRHEHWCRNAHKVRGQAPTAECIATAGPIACGTEILTARQVRRFKSRPGQIRVTWSNGGMTWEVDR